MTIGELLKQERLQQEKTQKEWIGDIVSQSYYAKVEKNIHRISAADLIKILTRNNVSFSNFAKELNHKKLAREKLEIDQKNRISNLLYEATYNNSEKDLRKIKKLLSNKNFNLSHKEEWLLYTDAEISEVTNQQLDKKEALALKDKLFNMPSFDKLTLELYCNLMHIYDFDSNIVIAKRIINQFQNTNNYRTQEIILGIIDNILIDSIEQNRYEETGFFIKAADQITTKPELFFVKNMLLLLENLIEYHFDKQASHLVICTDTIKNMKRTGLQEYADQIEKFITEHK
ncbi:Rgg/GadR/MutR family transcriptional regulator [Lactobacillus sp. ESL0791]|uniref:helix-turn-helix domain-containing protein n=1 Tax=Lactobacillus sp. ESL0791 TaxID=2983234 RepID=UPI0023F95535|nr:Rgg/GadR/MutR family transcriptional regulator [Lactobacillus sp. ESL0791]MDF7639872.1 Rgg/GadR/MutR family transcriptional regulator [Lactobacillus sp. ESL0791]